MPMFITVVSLFFLVVFISFFMCVFWKYNKYHGGTYDATTFIVIHRIVVYDVIGKFSIFQPQKLRFSSHENITERTNGPTDGLTDGLV